MTVKKCTKKRDARAKLLFWLLNLLLLWRSRCGHRRRILRSLIGILRRRRQRWRQLEGLTYNRFYKQNNNSSRREITEFWVDLRTISFWIPTRFPFFSSNLTSQLSSNWVTWYNGEKVSKDMRSIFHRRCLIGVAVVESYGSFRPIFFKADLDGTLFASDYCERLTYFMTFDHPNAHNFHLRHPRACCTNVVCLIYTTRSVVKSWRSLRCVR